MGRNLALLAVCGTTAVCSAQVSVFVSKSAWATAAGGPRFLETLSGFPADAEFRVTPRALAGGMTIIKTGDPGDNFRNEIDVPPLDFSDGNGTAFLSSFVNSPEGANPGVGIQITFATPLRAFGFESSKANELEGVVAEVYGGGVLLGSVALSNASGAFTGFVADSRPITSMRLRARRLVPGAGGEGFALDNLEGVAGVNFLGSLAAWNAAAPAVKVIEDFSSIIADLEFRTGPRALPSGLQIGQLGVNIANFRNELDAPPVQFSDNNGTAHASCFTNFPEASNPLGTEVLLAFPAPVHAAAFETWGARGGEGAVLEVRNGSSVLATLDLANDAGLFTGFDLGAGLADRLVLRSGVLNLGSGGEGFGLDNVRSAPAAVIFSNRGQWETAAGPRRVNETFSSFGQDREFRDTTRQLAGSMTIRQSAASSNTFRNEIDAPPLQFGFDSNGTTNASSFVNAEEPGEPATEVILRFGRKVKALGFETWAANDGEGAVVDLYDDAQLLGSITLSNSPGVFAGFVLPRRGATEARFRARTVSIGPAGEGFALDNIAIVFLDQCPGDLNDDGLVDDTDFVYFTDAYDTFLVPPANAAADLNDDGFVDDADFVIFAQSYDQFVCP